MNSCLNVSHLDSSVINILLYLLFPFLIFVCISTSIVAVFVLVNLLRESCRGHESSIFWLHHVLPKKRTLPHVIMEEGLHLGNLTLWMVTGWVLWEAGAEPEIGLHSIKRRTQDWAGGAVWLWWYPVCQHKEQPWSQDCPLEDFHVGQKLLSVLFLSDGMGAIQGRAKPSLESWS